jgi:hypothetical protein
MGEPRIKANMHKLLSWAFRYGLPALVFAYAFLLLFVPLSDPDLFWHLKSGQWTLENRELPGREDPFSYTTPKPIPEPQVEGIRSQWLGQVVLYLVYALGGYPGLIVFRSLMILLPFLIVYSLALKRGLSPLWALSLVSLPILLMAFSMQYTFERPQAFTILFSFALVPVLERLRSPGGRLPWVLLLAFMMALWSNLHGGFIFGVVMIAAFTIGVLLEAIFKKNKEELLILIPISLGVTASLLNPNTYSLLYRFLYSQLVRFISGPPEAGAIPGKVDVVGELLEYKPLWFFYEKFYLIWPLFIIAFIAFAVSIILAGHVSRRKVRLPELFMAAAIVVFSIYYSRGAMLSLVVLPLFAVRSAGDLGKPWRFVTGVAGVVLCAMLVVVTVQRSPWQLRPTMPPASWVDRVYPEGAVRFIKENGIEGPMFNEFRWGGFLIWRLYPEHKVFIDGRIMSNTVLETHMSIMMATPGALKELDAFGVNFVLVQTISRESGVIIPLVLKFLEEEPQGWRLVHMEGNSALFIRKTPKNRHVIERYGLPYKALYGPIYAEAKGILGDRYLKIVKENLGQNG